MHRFFIDIAAPSAYYIFNVYKNARRFEDSMKRSSGFSLAELLIVVAIISILVGVAFPVFNSVLERSRETVDAANIRSEYAHILTSVVNGEYDKVRDANAYTVQLVQTEDD